VTRVTLVTVFSESLYMKNDLWEVPKNSVTTCHLSSELYSARSLSLYRQSHEWDYHRTRGGLCRSHGRKPDSQMKDNRGIRSHMLDD
jgi:hypothetical protein